MLSPLRAHPSPNILKQRLLTYFEAKTEYLPTVQNFAVKSRSYVTINPRPLYLTKNTLAFQEIIPQHKILQNISPTFLLITASIRLTHII
jgi:hypothetical protein